MRHVRIPRVVAAGAVVVLSTLAGLPVSEATASTATAGAPTACPPGTRSVTRETRDGPTGKIVRVQICVSLPGNPGDPPGDGGGGGGGGEGDNDGNYLQCNPVGVSNPGFNPTPPPGTPPDAKPYYCVQYIGGNPQYGPYIVQWLTPGELGLPTPEQVAAQLLADIRQDIPDPVVVPYPEEGEPAVLKVPSFVSVSNWQDAYTTPESCDPTGQICVTLTLTPELTFDPGDGADPVACAGGGTVYRTSDGTPREVARRPGACTHTYMERTGVDGRGAAYDAVVTVTWTISYQQTEGGTVTGTLDPLPLDDGFAREVEELQSVGRDPDE